MSEVVLGARSRSALPLSSSRVSNTRKTSTSISFPGRIQARGCAGCFALLRVLLGGEAIHAGHMTVGIGVITMLLVQAWRPTRSLESPAYEGGALYWHLVDVIWIFLYPLLYLPGQSG